MTMKTLIPLVLLCTALASCSSETGLPPAMDLRSMEAIAPQTGNAGTGSSWDGVVEAVQQADLTAQTAGRVSAVLVDVNDRVSAGQVLLRLSGVEQRAGAEAARAQAAAARAQAVEAETSYRRYAGLAKQQYISKQQLDQALAAKNAAQANARAAEAVAAQAAQQADYTEIRAPYSGVLSQRLVEPGESVAPGQPLLRVFNPDRFRVQIQVPQGVAAIIRTAPQAEVVLVDGTVLTAESVLVYDSADAASHSVSVRVHLPKTETPLVPGQVASVRFAATTSDARIRLPETAIWHRGELSGAYVIGKDRLLLRQLRLGESRDGYVEVISGLSEGERVAADPVRAAQALSEYRAKQEN
ncbi:efflux RND transporter periplasmic adaptor subunit [Arenimonas sp. GDDSR-1]|uniref:efflux RND transporter periplasmic adaptor subunit n=1 Tax=Arenimonas sp. GDDSR-1 TaxID=2950125 RepID=UPI00260C16F5|nr:efflux RND transporter periplasmic adaptor subunit [Arenimonas sp. GDDSR-1]